MNNVFVVIVTCQLKTEFPCLFKVNSHSFKQDLKKFTQYYNERRIQQKFGFLSPKDYYLGYQKIV
jgi:putative transposase